MYVFFVSFLLLFSFVFLRAGFQNPAQPVALGSLLIFFFRLGYDKSHKGWFREHAFIPRVRVFFFFNLFIFPVAIFLPSLSEIVCMVAVVLGFYHEFSFTDGGKSRQHYSKRVS